MISKIEAAHGVDINSEADSYSEDELFLGAVSTQPADSDSEDEEVSLGAASEEDTTWTVNIQLEGTSSTESLHKQVSLTKNLYDQIKDWYDVA